MEDIQVLRYEPGQKNDPHYDYFTDKVHIARGGHRIATVLMYLTDVVKGGETVFPKAEESSRHRIRSQMMIYQIVQKRALQSCNPDFVEEVVSLFFEDSEKLLNELTRALDQKIVDFKKVDAYVHQFKGSSSIIGAQQVKNACIAFRNFCDEQNTEACVRCLLQVKHDYSLVKNKLETLFRLEQQIVEAGGSVPMLKWCSSGK